LPDAGYFRFNLTMGHGRYKVGTERSQASLLPARVEDYVAANNPVRAIEAYAEGIDLAGLGFRHAERGVSAGQPPYDPADLLKLYLYGYLNRVRSSRALEREAGRNLEVIWLLRSQTPGYRTIAKFRAENATALRAANRDFVRLLGRLGLLGGSLVAIDGAFFDGNASKASMVTAKRLTEQLAALDRDIDAYAAAVAADDAREEAETTTPAGDAGARMAELVAQRDRVAADRARLEASGETQLSRTDPDARLLSKSGQTVSGYNVQIAVDDAHKLIVASEVVNDGNDSGQLHAVAQAAKEALEVETLNAVADAGYFNGETLRACKAEGITPFVPEPSRGRAAAAASRGRFGLEKFTYDAAADRYRCPAGEELRPMPGRKHDVTGKTRIRYATRRSVCRACPLRQNCLSGKAERRQIERWEHEDVLERHRARMKQADGIMRRRKALAEHPFGTLKCRAGYRHFLVRGFAKVRGEWSLMALCYNLSRLLTIIGVARFIAWIVDACAQIAFGLLAAAAMVLRIALAVRSPESPATPLRTGRCRYFGLPALATTIG
jgi:transposase